MKSRVSLMCSLVLAASLASCAPRVQGPDGKFYTPDIRAVGTVEPSKIILPSELTDQTSESSYVALPGCQDGVVSVRDVRLLGVVEASETCSQTVKQFNANATFVISQIAAGALAFFGVQLIIKWFFDKLGFHPA